MDIEKSLSMATGIVSAFVSHTHVAPADIPKILADTHKAVTDIATGQVVASADAAPAGTTPREVRASITHDKLISFEDGKPYKTLRRHLTLRGLTPEQYRTKHGLPPDYPMTSVGYSETRSALAKSIGLGQRNRPSQA